MFLVLNLSVYMYLQVLRELMNQTFSFRRQDLLNDLTIHDLLDMYPPLQDPEEVRDYCKCLTV